MKASIKNILLFIKKLRFLDYLIIVFFVLALFLFYKLIHQEKRWVQVKVMSKATNFYLDSLRIGSNELDSAGKKIAEVTNFQLIDSTDVKNPFANKILLLNLKILVNTGKRKDYFEYKNQPIAVGSNIPLNFDNATVAGLIISVETDNKINQKLEDRIMTIQIYNQWPWYADSIKVGDYQKTSEGEKLIEVASKEVTPAQNPITIVGEQQLTGTVDVLLKIKVGLQKFSGGYIFQGYDNVFIGDPISFTVGKTRIQGIISNIE